MQANNLTRCAGLAVILTAAIIAVYAINVDDFWTKAAQSGKSEVALSNLALQKSQNEQIKQFAQQIVTDHTAANTELQTLASGKNVTLPTDVNSKQSSTYDKLNGLSGAEFDREYMKVMVKDHDMAVKMFQKESETESDADVKAFAAKYLPALKSHLEMAKSMTGGSTMKMDNSNSDRNMNMKSNKDSNSNSNSNRKTRSNSNSNSKANDNKN